MKNRGFTYKAIVCILVCSVILAGCWDLIEIDNLLFVGNIGIDSGSEIGKFTFIFTIPIVREIVGGGSGGGEGGGKQPSINIKTVASSVVDGARNLSLRLNRVMFFEHMRILVISEDVAKNDLKAVINPFERQTEFNRRSRISICQGKAEKVLEVNPWVEKLKSQYLESIFKNSAFSGKFIDRNLGDFLHDLHTHNGNALVSKITPDTTEVYVGGAGVIKGYHLVGWLSEDETQGANFFMNNLRGGNIVVKDEDCGNITFIIRQATSKLHLVSYEAVPELVLNVNVEGHISSTDMGIILDIQDVDTIQALVSKKINSQISSAIYKLQNTYEADVIGLGNYIYKYHPKLWKQYEHNWDEIFPEVKISVQVNTKIKNIGVVR